MEHTYWLDARDKPGLLVNLLEFLAGNAQILLQGSLGNCDFSAIPKGEVWNETSFTPLSGIGEGQHVVLKLEPVTIKPILAEVLPHGRIVHEVDYIVIEKNGRVEFMAGDNFHNECISVGPGVSEEFLKTLVERGILRGFKTDALAKKTYEEQAQQRHARYVAKSRQS